MSTVAFIVGLALTEFALRLLHLAPTGGVFTVNARQFTEIPGIFAPHQDVLVLTKRQLPHRVRINALGYRGPELTLAKPAGEFRILYVGDSGTFGDFVSDEETLPAQLETRLARHCPGIRVINAGLGGSTITEQDPLVMRSLVLDPDLVILMFSENDVNDLAGESMWDQLASNRAAKSRFPVSFLYQGVRNTALWNLVLRIRGISRAGKSTRTDIQPARSGGESANRTSALRAEYAARVAGLKRVLEERGVPLVLTAYPNHRSVYRTWDSDQLGWLAGIARNANIRYIDLFEPLLATGLDGTKLYLLPVDGHASSLGYSVTSGVIELDLLRHGDVPCGRASFAPTERNRWESHRAPATGANGPDRVWR